MIYEQEVFQLFELILLQMGECNGCFCFGKIIAITPEGFLHRLETYNLFQNN